MSGDEVVRYLEAIKGTKVARSESVVMEQDPQKLERGMLVELYPSDWGSEHRDSGRLVALAPDEVTIIAEATVDVRIHAPRAGFKVRAVGKDAANGSTQAE